MQLHDIRLQICQAGSMGGHNRAWDILAIMVHKLGIDRNSSDVTDGEDGSYAVRFREWRSSQVKKLLVFIDQNCTREPQTWQRALQTYSKDIPTYQPRHTNCPSAIEFL